MKENHVRHLFNEPGDRRRVRAGFARAATGRPRIALALACYSAWIVACCSGPAVELGGVGAAGAVSGAAGWLLPAWTGPLACMAVASIAIAVWFRRTRKVPTAPSWLLGLASLMTLASALHLVWALDVGLPAGARLALYALASAATGAGGALFRVEVDRVLGWVGTQETLYQVMLGTVAAAALLSACSALGDALGARGVPLLVAALVLPFASAALVRAIVRGFPKARYYGHGRDVPLPFPAKFVATSCVQGLAAGALFMGMFVHGVQAAGGLAGPASAGGAAVAGSTAGAAAALGTAWLPDGTAMGSLGQAAAVALLFATLVFLRLDFNRLVYKVAFPLVAGGFVFVAASGVTPVGNAVLAGAFCYLDLVLWSLGACLMKNMGLPATWIASCPGAALFSGAVAGGLAACAFLAGAPAVPAVGAAPAEDPALLAYLVACIVLAAALFLSSGSNLKYGWGTVRPGEGGLATGDLAAVVRLVATEREVTQRESEVMLLLAEGKSRRAVCEALSVSPDTVKTHVRSIYRKLAVHSQQELVDYLAREREDLAADGSEHPLEA